MAFLKGIVKAVLATRPNAGQAKWDGARFREGA